MLRAIECTDTAHEPNSGWAECVTMGFGRAAWDGVYNASNIVVYTID